MTKVDPMDSITGGGAPVPHSPKKDAQPKGDHKPSKLEKHLSAHKKIRKIPTSIYLKPETLEKLSETAKKYNMSNSKMVEVLVEMGLKGE